MNHRREHARRLLAVPSTLIPSDGSPVKDAYLIDMSRKGVGFLCKDQLEDNARFALRFQFPGQNDADLVQIEIVYSILHATSGLYRCGALIQAMSPDTAAHLLDFVTMPITA